MTATFASLFRTIGSLFRWWMVVTPWEQAIRVRLGKRVAVLGAGVHLAIPFVDRFYVQGTRLRMMSLDTQTLTTTDGKTVTIGANLGYKIIDLQKLYETLHDADGTLTDMAENAIAKYVSTHPAAAVTAQAIEDAVQLELEEYGISCAGVRVANFAYVRTYRIINDTYRRSLGTRLSTNRAVGTPADYD